MPLTHLPLRQVFGWDFLLDEELNVWVIEVYVCVCVCVCVCVQAFALRMRYVHKYIEV
jgi:hypothetical protein